MENLQHDGKPTEGVTCWYSRYICNLMQQEETATASSGDFDYVITLKSPGYRHVNIVSQVLLLIFLTAYFYYLIRLGMFGTNLWLVVIPLLIIGLWLYGWVRSADKSFQVNYRMELMVAAMAWMLLPLAKYHVWFGVGYAIMSVIERWVKFPDEIGFTKEKVVRNSFPKKKYEWFEIDNVMIRDNIFTLDLRNNHIIQKELDEPVSAELIAEFNAYCKEQLHFRI